MRRKVQIFSWSVKTTDARIRLAALKVEIQAIGENLPRLAAFKAVEEAKATDRWKDRTGRTRGSIEATRGGKYTWRFRAGGVSEYLNYGTGLQGPKGSKYTIRPRSPGGMLRFFWEKIGQRVEFKKVSHPGVPKTLFIGKAKMKAEDYMLDQMSVQLNDAIRTHNR